MKLPWDPKDPNDYREVSAVRTHCIKYIRPDQNIRARIHIVCFNQIEVYKLDKETNNATLIKSIDVGDLAVANVALAEDYIVICSHDRKIHIWNRNTGEKMVYPGAELLSRFRL